MADKAARRLGQKVIRDLQRMHHTLSGDGSELHTTWDEICAQGQYEHSFLWDAYDETVRGLLLGYIAELAEHEREAIWLQSDAGRDWLFDEPDDRWPYPVCDDNVVDYVAKRHVYAEADRWSNARIRAFIDRSMIRD